jgi:hypothetical protein
MSCSPLPIAIPDTSTHACTHINTYSYTHTHTRARAQAGFIRNSQGEVICDRSFNVASLLSYYYNRPVSDYINRTRWNKDDPNVLDLNLQG